MNSSQQSAQNKLFAILSKYRNQKAKESNLPAYCIFDNKSLGEMIEYLPATFDELVKIKGFGHKRAEKYGEDIINLVSDFIKNNNIEKQDIPKVPTEDDRKKLNEDIAPEVENTILRCVNMFSGEFGKSGIIKILKASDSIFKTENKEKYYARAIESEFFGCFKEFPTSVLENTIEKLVNENKLKIAGNFRPLLMVNNPSEIIKPEKIVLTKNLIKPKEDEKDFLRIVELIEQKRNIFVTGNAGTGKSYLLNKLKLKYKKRLELTSTTGLAAVNIKGVTIHSWAGVGICKKDISRCVSDILEKRSLTKKIKNCELLAIDEISMLKGQTFSYIDEVLRRVRENDEPFGGIQLLLFGDFFQLPPVEENYGEKDFCFDSQTWRDLNLEVVKLETIYRQTEKEFIKALNDIRMNRADNEDINLLKSRVVDYDTTDTSMLHLFSRNDEANNYNYRKFKTLDAKIYQYTATSGVYRGEKFVQKDLFSHEQMTLEIFKKNCRVAETLYFKKGCRVMLLINLDFDKGLINGSCGEITDIADNKITVKFDNGVETDIEQNKFEYYYNDKLSASMTQYPLQLAYAITIHKSQGMTLENVVVDCNSIFEEGQLYVALSRVKRLEGLYLKGFSANKIRVNQRVADFYERN